VNSAAADAALFTLGVWAASRRGGDEDGDISARIVSTEQDAWLDADGVTPEERDEADGLLGASIWRPERTDGGRGPDPAGGSWMSIGALRSAPPPKDYDPVAAAEAAAAQAEAAEAERLAAEAHQEEPEEDRNSADLLVQDPDMWGTPRPDWDTL
jgi:hypothetical protein